MKYTLTLGKDAIICTDANGNQQIYLPAQLAKSIANLTAQMKMNNDRTQAQIDAQNNLLNEYNKLIAVV